MLEKIIKECPEAWAEFCKSQHCENYTRCEMVLNETFWFYWETSTQDKFIYFRSLYDYFDLLGIRIEIGFAYREKGNESYFVGYDWDIDNPNGEGLGTIEFWHTRTEAEWNAFYEAFKIRESQLCS